MPIYVCPLCNTLQDESTTCLCCGRRGKLTKEPTRSEIDAAKALIQQGWSTSDEQRRCCYHVAPVEIPREKRRQGRRHKKPPTQP